MSTNSTIAVVLPNQQVLSVTCHFDGYVSHNGRMLSEHFNEDWEYIEDMLLQGNLRCINDDGSYESYNDKGYVKYNNKTEWLGKCNHTYNYLFEDGNWYLFIHNDSTGIKLSEFNRSYNIKSPLFNKGDKIQHKDLNYKAIVTTSSYSSGYIDLVVLEGDNAGEILIQRDGNNFTLCG